MHFTCEICQKEHELYPHVSIPLPQKIINLIDSESPSIKKHDGIYITKGGNIITIGNLILDTNFDFSLNIKLWVSIDGNEIIKKKENVRKSEPISTKGKIVSDLSPLYSSSENIEIDVMVSEWSYDDAEVEFLVTNHDEIMRDQKDGISKEKLIRLMSRIYHPSE